MRRAQWTALRNASESATRVITGCYLGLGTGEHVLLSQQWQQLQAKLSVMSPQHAACCMALGGLPAGCIEPLQLSFVVAGCALVQGCSAVPAAGLSFISQVEDPTSSQPRPSVML